MRVVVTGGLGCIGLAVTAELVSEGFQVVVYDLPESRFEGYQQQGVSYVFGSILDKTCLLDSFSGADAVIHLAAYLGVERTEANRLRGLDINISGTSNVVEAAALCAVKKFIFASSSEIYGSPDLEYISEECNDRGKSVYAISKLAGEEIVKGYQAFSPYEATILRFFNTFGPRQEPQFVIPRFISAVLSGDAPTIYGSGNQVRSYCYVSDTAKGIVAALRRAQTERVETYNIGNPKNEVNLNELASIVCEILNREISPIILGSFDGADRQSDREIQRRVCDITKASKYLNFEPSTSLHAGLKGVVFNGMPLTRWVN